MLNLWDVNTGKLMAGKFRVRNYSHLQMGETSLQAGMRRTTK